MSVAPKRNDGKKFAEHRDANTRARSTSNTHTAMIASFDQIDSILVAWARRVQYARENGHRRHRSLHYACINFENAMTVHTRTRECIRNGCFVLHCIHLQRWIELLRCNSFRIALQIHCDVQNSRAHTHMLSTGEVEDCRNILTLCAFGEPGYLGPPRILIILGIYDNGSKNHKHCEPLHMFLQLVIASHLRSFTLEQPTFDYIPIQ